MVPYHSESTDKDDYIVSLFEKAYLVKGLDENANILQLFADKWLP